MDARITYPIRSPGAVFSIRTTAGRELGDYLKTPVRYIPSDGEGRAIVITSNSGTVALNPSWLGAASNFIRLGIAHILTGYDHLLFLLCLVIPFRKLRGLIPIVTAFTVAHSVTLIASAYDFAPSALWFPPLVETAIAASIVYMALENVAGANNLHRRWVITFCFGLIHGFGFSFALRETLQLSHIAVVF